MFRKVFVILAIFITLSVSSGTSWAISLFVDSAPNVDFLAGDYSTWWNEAKQKVAGGSFINMEHSVNPAYSGTTNFNIRDMVVYDIGNYGKQLSLVFWLPNQSISTMTDEFKLQITVFDNMSNSIEFSWFEPTAWEDFNNGLIGTVGFAWDAAGSTTQSDLDEYINYLGATQGDIIFEAKRDDTGETELLRASYNPVPEPSTFLLLGAGLAGLGFLRRGGRSKRNRD